MSAAALLAAILANPDDDTPRLVFSDWLEEQGDIDRATFIRIQVRQAQIASSLQIIPGYVEDQALARQARELLSRHPEWLTTLPQSLRRGQAIFHRGFIEELALPVNQLLKVSGRVWASHPIRRLQPGKVTDQLEQVLTLAQLPCIRILSLRGLSPRDLTALTASACLSQLRELTVSHKDGDSLVKSLARSPSLGGLTTLFLGMSHLDPEALAQLTASASVVGLTKLRLDALRQGAAERAQVLARSPALSSLKRLFLSWVEDEGVTALADSPHLGGLEWLILPHSGVTPAGVKALASTRHLLRLRALELPNNALGQGGIRALAGAAWTDLARLDLQSCALGDDGVTTLAECPSLSPLSSLSLDSNDITAAGVRALARSGYLENLSYLSLYANKIGDEGALALCASETMSKLQLVGLEHCGPFSPKVQDALRQRFGAGVRM